MYTGKIEKYTFEHDAKTNRINVYEDGCGVDPIELIKVNSNLTEKEFHYEIMDFVLHKSYLN